MHSRKRNEKRSEETERETTQITLATSSYYETKGLPIFTCITFDVAPATAAMFKVAPATAALEAAVSAISVVGGVEEGSGGAIIIDVVEQSTTSAAASTVLPVFRHTMACAIKNSLYQRAKNEKESKSEQSMCCSTKHAFRTGGAQAWRFCDTITNSCSDF
eukprot:scaffold28403_cov50-Attheya_sp.AAC.1